MKEAQSLDSGIDFSVLGEMSIPSIDQGPKLKKVTKADQKEIREDIINDIETVDSLEDFTKKVSEKSKESENNAGTQETEDLIDDEIPGEIENPPKETQKQEELSVVKGLAEWAKTQGLIEYDDDKIEDSEDWLKETFNTRVQKEAQAGITQYKENIPGIVKDILDNYEEGVPLDELVYSKSRQIEYNGIDEKALEDNKDLQKKLVADWLTNQEYTQKQIEAKLQKYEDAVMLEDEAKEALEKLKVYEAKYQEQLQVAAKENQKQRQLAFEQKLKEIEKDITSSEEFIPGIKRSPDERKKVFEAYTKQDSKGKTALMKAIESDPKAWAKITDFMVLMGGNLESIKNKLKTEATNKVKNTVTTYSEDKGSLSKIDTGLIKKALKIAQKQNKI